MNLLDNKPTPQQDFYENYFLPTQREMSGQPIPAVLDRSLEKYPLQIRMSIDTLKRIRGVKRS